MKPKDIKFIAISEQGPEIWQKFAHVEYSASQKLLPIDKSTVHQLNESEMYLYHERYYTLPELTDYKEEGINYAFAAVLNDNPAEILGFLSGKLFIRERVASVNALYVLGDLQRKKLHIGKKLLKAAEKLAKRKGICEMSLTATETAQNFYIKMGFVNRWNMHKRL
ncbi:MAG: GNAT family N-acetyltransferase [Rickettsiales bacterium]|jgi:GNAT superfamily N-acetyltransferase|nr:GNAT family N-acetyltransferase [Rickettsiales bacterium]